MKHCHARARLQISELVRLLRGQFHALVILPWFRPPSLTCSITTLSCTLLTITSSKCVSIDILFRGCASERVVSSYSAYSDGFRVSWVCFHWYNAVYYSHSVSSILHLSLSSPCWIPRKRGGGIRRQWMPVRYMLSRCSKLSRLAIFCNTWGCLCSIDPFHFRWYVLTHPIITIKSGKSTLIPSFVCCCESELVVPWYSVNC